MTMRKNTFTDEEADAMLRNPTRSLPASRLPGLGDVVAGATTAAGVKPCGGCLRRKQAMNRLTPGWVKQMLHWLAGWLSRLAR